MRFLLLLTLMAYCPGLFAQSTSKITFDALLIRADTIRQNQKIIRGLKFTNLSPKPVKVEKVTTSCGCFYAQWPQYEILSTASDSIQFTFDSAGKLGFQKKMAWITFSDHTSQTISFETFVKPGTILLNIDGAELQYNPTVSDYFFEVTNSGTELVNISALATNTNEPDENTGGIETTIDKTALEPGKKAVIQVKIKTVPKENTTIQFLAKDKTGSQELYYNLSIRL